MKYAPLLLLLLVAAAQAETEIEACYRIAPKYGIIQEHIDFTLPDESRVDLLGDEYAWEVDWAPKWAEGVGQATLYGLWTSKKPGLILLVKDRRKEKQYILRAKLVCEHLKIRLEIEQSDPDPALAPPSVESKSQATVVPEPDRVTQAPHYYSIRSRLHRLLGR